MNHAAVEFKGVRKSYGSGDVLKDFSLSIPQGKIITIIGPSGCGKTTLLKMINRLIEPDEGRVIIEGREIDGMDPVHLRRNIGYVIQQIGLFPHMTIEENISIVSRLKGEPIKKLKNRTDELLKLIGLNPDQYRKRYPHELSGGQQQRVGVARALASDPSIILMDEPFSALDPISRVQLQKELIKLNQQLKKTIIFITHDIDEALKIADQIILLNEGKIVQKASPKELLKYPENEFVRTFVGPERFHSVQTENTVNSFMVGINSIPFNMRIAEAMKVLQREQKEELIITNDSQEYLGVIHINKVSEYLKENGKLSVSEIMETNTPHIFEHTSISEVLFFIKHHSILPVINDERKLQGIVTRSDIIDSLNKTLYKEEISI